MLGRATGGLDPRTRASRLAWLIGCILVMVAASVVAPARADTAADTFTALHLSSSSSGSVGGVSFADEDILLFEPISDTWERWFDGSDVGLGGVDLNAFHIDDPWAALPTIYMSFQQPTTITGVGSVDDSDIVIFTPTSLGTTTAGSFSMWLDGSDMSLSANGEDIDSIAFLGDGRLVISTVGGSSVPATGGGTVSGGDEDLLVRNPDDTFERLIDSSDVSFTGDTGSAWIDVNTDEIHMSSNANYTIGALTGDSDDSLIFTGTTGDPTSGSFTQFFDGDEHGFGGEQIDGMVIRKPLADVSVTITESADPIDDATTLVHTIEVFNAGPSPAVGVTAVTALEVGLELDSSSGCAEDPNGLVCSLGTIAAGDSVTYTLAVLPDTGVRGLLATTVIGSSGFEDPDTANNTAVETTAVNGAPVAADDGELTTAADTVLTVLDVRDNDELGYPSATISTFGGGDLGGTVDDNAAGATVSVAAGDVTLTAVGTLTYTPASGFVGDVAFDYRLENTEGSTTATISIEVGSAAVLERNIVVHVSSSRSGTVGGVTFEDEDVLEFDSAAGTWTMLMDGSDIGLGSRDVDAVHVVDNGGGLPTILFSVANPMRLATVGPVDDSDIVRLVPTSLGDTTAGTLDLWFDASTVGLDTWDEDVDALFLTDDGRMAVSTLGPAEVPGPNGSVLSTRGEDLIVLEADDTFSLLYDGTTTNRPMTAAWLDPSTDLVHATFDRSIASGALVGDGDDIFVFPRADGAATDEGRLFDGDDHTPSLGQIDAISFAGSATVAGTRPPVIESNGGGDAAWISHEENTDAPGTVIWGTGVFIPTGSQLSSSEVIDASGNVYATGFFQGTVDFDPGAGVDEHTAFGGFDIFVTKLDSAGDHVWTLTVGGPEDDRGAGVDVDAGGDVYLTGYFQSSVDFNPGPNIDALTASGVEDVFVARYDSTGELVWIRGLDGEDDLVGTGVGVDESGTLISVDNFVADVDATDPDGESSDLVYSFTTTIGGEDNGLFALGATDGLLTFLATPDFETPADLDADNDYEVEVTVTDLDGLTDTQTMTIRITDDPTG